MNKIKHVAASALTLLLSVGIAYAALQSLNGQTGNNQLFANDTNVTMSSVGDVHTLGWNGVLPVERGGTGDSNFEKGSIPFFGPNKLKQDNANLFWDNVNNRLGVGTNAPEDKLHVSGGNLVVGGNATSVITGDGSPSLLRGGIADGGNFELFYDAGEEYSIFRHSSHTSGFFMDGSHLGIGWTPGAPLSTFDHAVMVFPGDNNYELKAFAVAGTNTGGDPLASNAFSVTNYGFVTINGGGPTNPTLQIGSSTLPGCLIMGDNDGDGATYIIVNDGVLTASTEKPMNCR